MYYSLATPAGEIQALILKVLRQNLPAAKGTRQDYKRLITYLATKKPMRVKHTRLKGFDT